MTVKAYVHLLSQPARAILLFMKQTKIPHTVKLVDLMSGEHRTPEYLKDVHPLGKVPAIEDDGLKIFESVAILRYLARKYDVPDHWYPKDLKSQARVDEYLEWQHIGARAPLAMYFRTVFLIPAITGKPADEAKVESWKKKMESALDEIENVWLKRSSYLGGDKISIADIIGLCEIDQPRMAQYEPGEGRPNLTNWLKRVRSELQPGYDEVTSYIREIVNQNKSKL